MAVITRTFLTLLNQVIFFIRQKILYSMGPADWAIGQFVGEKMHYKRLFPLSAGCIAALFSVVATVSGAPVVTNGNFGTPTLAAGSFTTNMSGTGWTLEGSGAGGLVQAGAAGFTAAPAVPSTQWCYLAPPSNGLTAEYLEQDVETNGVQAEKGQTINFSFEQYYQTNLDNTPSADIQIRLDYNSDINDFITGDSMSFPGLQPGQSALRTGSFTVPKNFNHTGDLYLVFEAAELVVPGSGPGNVSISDVTLTVAPLPAPAAMGLCGLALAFVAARQYKGRAAQHS
jgi:hypothetical protein